MFTADDGSGLNAFLGAGSRGYVFGTCHDAGRRARESQTRLTESPQATRRGGPWHASRLLANQNFSRSTVLPGRETWATRPPARPFIRTTRGVVSAPG
jgi:hypothetical protein